jgi:hypothetical protein
LRSPKDFLAQTTRILCSALRIWESLTSVVARLKNALECCEKPRKGWKESFGEENPLTLALLSVYGEVQHLNGDSVEAATMINRVLTLERRILASEHHETLKSMTKLSAIYGDLNRYSDQERLLSEITDIQNRILGAEHPDTLDSMFRLVKTYCFQGRVDDTGRLVKGLLPIQKRVFGESHLKTQNTIVFQVWYVARSGHLDEARRLLADCRSTLRATEKTDTGTNRPAKALDELDGLLKFLRSI